MKKSINQHSHNNSLKDKTIVITGASSGAGRAAALEFAKQKVKLVFAARNGKALNELVIECKELGAKAIAIKIDVTNARAMQYLAIKANEFGGKIDVWINNAGVLAAGEFSKTPVEVHTQVIKINLIGYINGAHAVLPYFKRQRQGVLINNISVGGWFPVPYASAYSSSKFGLRGFSEALKGELIKYPRIYVCDLFPAFLDTPGIQHAANFTGSILKPAPPVYDPQRVARTMVHIAKYPKKSATVGSVSSLLRIAHFIMPGFTRFITAKVMETYFKTANPTAETTGNLFEPVEYGTSVHGGWSINKQKGKSTKALTGFAIIAGFAMGLYMFSNKKI